MAMIDVSPSDSWQLALAPLAGWPEIAAPARPFGALKELAARFFAWRAKRETLRILNSVDRATLRDLGITDIESVVYGAPEGHKRNYDPDWWRRGTRRSAMRIVRRPSASFSVMAGLVPAIHD